MTENKRYTTDNGSNEDVCLVDNVTGKEFESDFDEIVDLLNEQEERIKELENKLNQTALEFLNHAIISMGKAVEISEMSYHDFIKYRAEHGNPMELQL